jgi:hypothetical protein
MNSWLLLFLWAIVSLAGTAMAAPAPWLEGTYDLVRVTDSDDHEVTWPREDQTFTLRLTPVPDDPDTYRLHVKIGNNMGCGVHVHTATTDDPRSGQATVTLEPVHSTMMMPPEELFKLEMVLSRVLPQITSIELDAAQQRLTLRGAQGTLVARTNVETKLP